MRFSIYVLCCVCLVSLAVNFVCHWQNSLLTRQLYRTFNLANCNCVSNKYLGFQLLTPFGKVSFEDFGRCELVYSVSHDCFFLFAHVIESREREREKCFGPLTQIHHKTVTSYFTHQLHFQDFTKLYLSIDISIYFIDIDISIYFIL